jgi:hypothetical protein
VRAHQKRKKPSFWMAFFFFAFLVKKPTKTYSSLKPFLPSFFVYLPILWQADIRSKKRATITALMALPMKFFNY